ncbi:MAG TPA: Ig-like domain-containing protein [Thermoleophilaceae bacterium]
MCLLGLVGAPAASAAPNWTEIDSLPEQILDVDADRVLYMPTTGTSATLALKDRHTDEVTPIALGDGMNPWGGFLTPYGVVIATSEPPGVGALYEWRDGTLTRLGALSGLQLKAAGSYVLWGNQDSSLAPLFLHRRDLATGTTIDLGSGLSGGQHDAYDDWSGSDLAANGDVAWWRSDGIYRYRAGVAERMDAPVDPATSGYPGFPRTDGTNVVWRTWTCCNPPRGSLRGNGPLGAFVLDQFTSGFAAKEPTPDYDYRVNGGWVAFTRGEQGSETVWTRSPTGDETVVSPPGDNEIAGLSDTGEVIYGTYDSGNNNRTSYLAGPGQDPVEVGTTWDNQRSGRGFSNYVFEAGGRWYSIAFGSLRRLQLTDAAVAGSQTEIDGGPEGSDPDSSPTFEFSSSVAGATFECRIDGADWEACSSPHTYPSLAEGQHTFLVRSVAPGGDVDPEPASQVWTVDTVAPAVTLTDPPAGGLTSDTPHFAGAAGAAPGDSDEVTVDVFAGGAATGTPVQTILVTRTGGTWSADAVDALPDGTYTARAQQPDTAGNAGLSAPRTFTVDEDPPDPFDLQSPADGAANLPASTQLKWEEAADSGGGVARYELWLDGSKDRDVSTSACSAGVCTAAPQEPLSHGPHTWRVRAVDQVAHVRDSTSTRGFSVDDEPPGDFALLDPADAAKTSDATPTLSWQAAQDAGSGLDHYSVWIDRSRVADVGTTQFTPGAPLADGSHVWRIEAVDRNGKIRASIDRTFRIDTTLPAASLVVSPNPVLTGDPVALDAAGTSDPDGGTIVRYEWDVDGDGAFERDTGATPRTSASYPTRREIRPAVRVTDDAGHAAVASAALSIRPKPPTGRAGVSIDDGARFTNDVRVTVHVVWPVFATHVLLSNDGGFGNARRRAVDEQIRWTIDSSGSERLPRTIYARFEGIDGRETYQDDIILDETAPRVILAAFASRDVSASSALRGAAKRTYRLRIKARDAVSGPSRMQITTNRRRPGPILRYRNSARFRASTATIYVRVRDAAGNWSRWKRVAR